MANIGVFRDDFYNAASTLAVAEYNSVAITGATVIPAQDIASAQWNYYNTTGSTAATLTTDTAANIIAYIQNAVAAAYKANVGGFASALGGTPPTGAPNLFNLTFMFVIDNTSSATMTLAGGTGVTITGTATTATTTSSTWLVSITGPTTVTFQRVMGGTN
jgi:hypothetical protein